MSNTQRNNWLQAQRVDVPHVKMLEDSAIFDFRSLLSGFISTAPYTLRGFTIPNASNFINAQASSIQISVSDSVVWIPSQADGSFLTVPTGTPNEVLNPLTNTNVVGSFTPNSTNFISVQLMRQTDPSTNDLVAFWDVDAKTEFTKTVPLGLVLKYRIVINTAGFGTNMPIAIVDVNSSGACTRIENAKFSPFRLGTGGAAPNPYASYTLTTENSLIVTANGQPDPFATGDFNLGNFKAWMDMVMSRILNLGGGSVWYAAGTSLVPGVNVSDLAFNSEFSVLTGSGSFVHDSVTAGLLEWTSNLNVRSIFGPLTYVISAGSVQLTDGQVGYINLVRHQDFQPSNTFTFTNGSNTVTAANTISGIGAGEWIKFANDNIAAYAKVLNVSGTSITLASNYIGSSTSGKALRCQGTYPTVLAADPTSVPVSGDTFWLAKRDDNAFPSLTISSPASSGLTRNNNLSTCTTTTAHGLVAGQSFSISGASDPSFNGRFSVSTVTGANTFTFANPGQNIGSGIAGNGTITFIPAIYLRLRGGAGELDQGESIAIDDETLANVLRFIGSKAESDVTPPYTIFPNSLCPLNYTSNNDLTQSISIVQGNVNALYEQLTEPSYDEPLVVITEVPVDGNHVQGPILSGTLLTLPPNSRAGFATQNYVVGKGYLQVYLNGQMLNQNSSFSNGFAPFTSYGMSGPFVSNLQFNGPALGGGAVQFTPGSPQTLTQTRFAVTLTPVGSPTGNLVAKVYTNSGGLPGTLLGTSTNQFPVPAISTSGPVDVNFTFSPGVALTGGTPYWFSLETDATYQSSSTAYVQWMIPSLTTPNSVDTNNGSTWATSVSNTPAFELDGPVVEPGDAQIVNGWSEVGAVGSQVNQIVINRNLIATDIITFRIGVLGGPGNGTGGGGGGGGITGASNIGSGSGVFFGTSGSNLVFKSINSNTGNKVTDNGLGTISVDARLQVNTYTTAHTANVNVDDLILVDASAGSVTITLPGSGATGKVFYIQRIDNVGANSVTISAGGNLINFTLTSLSLPSQGDTYTLAGNGVSNGWSVL